jgi:hypothetical protein
MAFPFLPVYSVHATVFDAYQVTDWSDLDDLPVATRHVLPLVLSLTQFVDKRTSVYEIKGKRNFQCRTFLCNNCDTFSCQFTRTKADARNHVEYWKLKAQPHAHSEACVQSSEIRHPLVLRNCPHFISILENGEDLKRKTIESILRVSGFGSASIHRTTFYNVRRYHLLLQRAKDIIDYWTLPRFLRRLAKKNPGTTVALQLDEQGCFYRLFLAFGTASKLFGNATANIIFVDCAASKTLFFDGVYCLFSSKDGNGNSLPLALAIIPSETVVHLAWCIQMMVKAGFDVENNPFFSDRGHLIAAARALAFEPTNLALTIFYCLEHIMRNVKGIFVIPKNSQQTVRNAIESLSESKTALQFCDNLKNNFPDTATGKAIALYLLRIHPRHYTVFANRSNFNQPSWPSDRYAGRAGLLSAGSRTIQQQFPRASSS